MKELLSKPLRLVPALRKRKASTSGHTIWLSEKGLKNILDAATEGYWSWNIPAGDAVFSEQFLKLVGFPAPQSTKLGSFLKSIIHPDDLEKYESRLQAHLAGGADALDCECRIRTSTGAFRWVRLHGRVVRRNKQGHPVQIVGTVLDRSDFYQLAHKELEQSHTQLSAIFDASEEMIWVVDPDDFRLLTFNQRVDELIFKTRGIHPRRGMTPEEISSQEAEGWKQFYQKVLEKGTFETEYRFVGLPNVLHLVSKCLIRDQKVFGICIIGQDITQRRHEEALRKSEEKFAKAFLDSPVALILTSVRNHCYLEVNQAFLDTTGYQKEEIIGKTPFELNIWVKPEQRSQFIESLNTGGSVRNMEVPFRTKSGEIRHALGSATKIEIDGEPCMLSVAVDITDLKRATEALRESEERLRIAIGSGPLYAFEWNPETDEIGRTGKSAEILDFLDDEPVQLKRHFTNRIHPDDRQKYLDTVARLSPQNPDYKVSFRLVRRDQMILWLQESGCAFFGPDNKIRKIAGITFDETETRQSERTLRELSGRLINSQEEERRRIARELHDHIGQELALLCAHAQRVDSGVADEEHTARADAHELYRKIKEVAVDVSKLSHRLHSSELDFLGLAAAAERLCRDFAGQHRINMDHQINDIPPRLDQARSLCFYRVLQESLQNVAKHSHATRVLVELYADDCDLTLRVVDNGIGFELSNVRFGSGLGLISMRERLNLVAGSFEINSGEGRGTVVTATVPIPVEACQTT